MAVARRRETQRTEKRAESARTTTRTRSASSRAK